MDYAGLISVVCDPQTHKPGKLNLNSINPKKNYIYVKNLVGWVKTFIIQHLLEIF